MARTQQSNSIRRFFVRIAIAGCFAVVTILAVSRFNEPKEILRVPMSIGGNLVLHDVLEKPNENFFVRTGFFSNQAIGNNYGTGTTLVFSFREEKTDRYLDWSWFKCIEVSDRFGDTIFAWEVRMVEVDGSKRRSGNAINTSSKEDWPNANRFASIRLPKIQTEGAASYRMISTQGECVASFLLPCNSLAKNPEFAKQTHSTESTSGDWNVQISEMDVRLSGTPSAAAKWRLQRQIHPKFDFLFRSNSAPREDVAVFTQQFSDEVGNIAWDGSLPRKQRLWNFQIRVARNSRSDLFEKEELKVIGRIDSAKTTSVELATKLPFVSCVFYPKGQHQGKVIIPSDNKHSGLFRTRSFQYGTEGRNAIGIPEIWSSGSSGWNGDGYHQEQRYSRRLANKKKDDSELMVDTFISVRGGNRGLATDITVNSSHPILVVQLEQPLVEKLLNIVCFDQVKRRLKVHALESDSPDLAFYLIEPDWDTNSIEIFGCLEELTKIDFYIAPPTENLPLPTEENSSYMVNLRSTEKGWEIKNRYDFDKLP